MQRIALSVNLLVASASCSTTLGLNDVTRGDGGGGELDRISALEEKVATLQASQDAILDALKPVAFRASLEAPETVHNGTPTSGGTLVEFDTVQLDTHNMYDRAAHQYVIPVPGQYIVIAIVGYSAMGSGRANCEIWIDGAGSSSRSETAVTTPGTSDRTDIVRVISTAAVQLDAGDRVYVHAFQDSGTDKMLLTEPRSTNLQIIRIPTSK
jgi:hypothetical protein